MTINYNDQNCLKTRKWLLQPLGKYYLSLIKQRLDPVLGHSFGYHLLVIGEPEFANCVTRSPIKHHILVHHNPDSKREIYSLCCGRQNKLPFENDSIDLVYLAHGLEMYRNPEEILFEVHRVLRAEGRLIISGFKSFSLFGIYNKFLNLVGKPIIHTKYMSNFNIKAQLQILGFSNSSEYDFFYGIPTNNLGFLTKNSLIETVASKFKLPFAAAYLIIAYKRVTTLTPIKPVWQPKTYTVDGLLETAAQK